MYILSFLNVRELASVERVSRYWRRLAEVPTHRPIPSRPHAIPRPLVVPLRQAEYNVTAVSPLLLITYRFRSYAFVILFDQIWVFYCFSFCSFPRNFYF